MVAIAVVVVAIAVVVVLDNEVVGVMKELEVVTVCGV